MSKLPSTKPKQIIKALKKAGFVERKSKGSHRIFTHPDGRRTLVAFHAKELSRIELKTILRQARLTQEDFLKFL